MGKDAFYRIEPGGNNTFELYEDDGESKQYLDGNYSIRLLKVSKNENEVVFTINKTNNPLYHENIDHQCQRESEECLKKK